jgi:hypothetical protein
MKVVRGNPRPQGPPSAKPILRRCRTSICVPLRVRFVQIAILDDEGDDHEPERVDR